MAREVIKVGMTPAHPGAFILDEVLEPLGLNVSSAAEVLGVRRATLSDLLNEKARLSPEMAMRVELAFGQSAEQLLRMQAWWDDIDVRKRASQLGVEKYKPVVRGQDGSASVRKRPLKISTGMPLYAMKYVSKGNAKHAVTRKADSGAFVTEVTKAGRASQSAGRTHTAGAKAAKKSKPSGRNR